MHETIPARGIARMFVRRVRRPVLAFPRVAAWGEPVSCGKRVPNIGQGPLEVLDDTAAVGAKDNAAAAAGAKSSHWASPAVIKEAKDFTFIPAERGHGHICNAWSVPCA